MVPLAVQAQEKERLAAEQREKAQEKSRLDAERREREVS